MEACALTNPLSTHVLTITFLFTTLLFLSHHTQPISAAAKPTTTFITTSCSTTTYPLVCLKTLSPYAATVQSDPWKLCYAALTVAIKSARSASAAVSRQKGITARDAAVIKDCIDNIGDSVDKLKQSLNAMGSINSTGGGGGGGGGGNESNKKFEMETVKTLVSAAITDENTCTDGFAGSMVSDGVKNKIRGGIRGLIRVTSNALSLINHLNY